jgi:hypothetical protein
MGEGRVLWLLVGHLGEGLSKSGGGVKEQLEMQMRQWMGKYMGVQGREMCAEGRGGELTCG